jgi:hypothetical protein
MKEILHNFPAQQQEVSRRSSRKFQDAAAGSFKTEQQEVSRRCSRKFPDGAAESFQTEQQEVSRRSSRKFQDAAAGVSRRSRRPVSHVTKDEYCINTVKRKLEINEKSARRATKNLNYV